MLPSTSFFDKIFIPFAFFDVKFVLIYHFLSSVLHTSQHFILSDLANTRIQSVKFLTIQRALDSSVGVVARLRTGRPRNRGGTREGKTCAKFLWSDLGTFEGISG